MEDSTNVILFAIGFFFRIGLMNSSLFGLSERPEFATPLNSFKRLKEGVYLEQIGRDPYDGVLFHETPYTLKIFSFLFQNCSESVIECIFAIIDVTTAFVISFVADLVVIRVLRKQEHDMEKYHKKNDDDDNTLKESLLIKESQLVSMSQYVKVKIFTLHTGSIIYQCNLLFIEYVNHLDFQSCDFQSNGFYQIFYVIPVLHKKCTKSSKFFIYISTVCVV